MTQQSLLHSDGRQKALRFPIYSQGRNDAWRFTLGTAGKRPLLVIGLNPSTANRERSDPTITRVERVADRHGFDSFVMLNLYPVRATHLMSLDTKCDRAAFRRNLQQIEGAISRSEAPVVWAAWGNLILKRTYFVDACVVLCDRLGQHVDWRHFGELTASGHPRHPSRLDYGWQFRPFDLHAYVRALRVKRAVA